MVAKLVMDEAAIREALKAKAQASGWDVQGVELIVEHVQPWHKVVTPPETAGELPERFLREAGEVPHV